MDGKRGYVRSSSSANAYLLRCSKELAAQRGSAAEANAPPASSSRTCRPWQFCVSRAPLLPLQNLQNPLAEGPVPERAFRR